MNPLQRERLELAIGYFAQKYHQKNRRAPSQTEIYKFLAFIEFASIRETGKPVFGLRYLAMEHGPVPIELYKEFKSQKFSHYKYFTIKVEEIAPNKKAIKIYPRQGIKLDLDLFSQREKALLEKYTEILIAPHLKSLHYSEASHEAIRAWKKAYEKKPNSVMDYADEVETEEAKERLETYLELEEVFGV